MNCPILIVEDEEVIRRLLGELLGKTGWELHFAARLDEARELLTRQPVAIALLDKNLPDGSGLSLVPAITQANPHAEVIVMTGTASVESAIEAVQLGVLDYLEKPFDPARLTRTLAHAVERVTFKREQQRLLAELRRSEARYALAAAAAHDGLWEWDLGTGEVYLTPRWWEILGCPPSERPATLDDWFGRIVEEDREHVRTALDAHAQGQTPCFAVEYRARHADGGVRWILNRGLAERDADGRALRIAGSHTDVTGRRLAEEQLRHDALHDALTGLPNQALFRDRVRVVLAKLRRRTNARASVLFIDLDRFKNVNDSLGHLAGDRLLAQFAQRLASLLRETDTCARLGGDEFAILLDDMSAPEDAEVVAGRIRAALHEPFRVDGHEVFASASIGIAACDPADDVEDTLRAADAAMYHAKDRGKGRHEKYDRSMADAPRRFLQLETELRRALERDELRVVYQPIVWFATGRCAGFEALLRWRSKAYGSVSPGEFILVAEETGTIVGIGQWVLEEATRRLGAWRASLSGADDLFMSVNVSRRQLTSGGLTPTIERVLGDSGVPAARLKLEVTETALVEDLVATRNLLERLRAMGVSLALDDFGTGYSSLSFLHHLPFDTLKIDRSFVSRIVEDASLIESILVLGKSLCLTTVAEGVETIEQAARLRLRGCGFGQGYLWARPLDADDVPGYLQAENGIGSAAASS